MTVMTAPVPSTDYDAYRRVLAEEGRRLPEAWTFKANPAYRQILEHVTRGQAVQCIECVRAEFPEQWPTIHDELPAIAALNDSLGTPEQTNFGWLTCSPSNLRYLWHALLIWRQIDSLEQPNIHLVELGGGYGGLALYVHKLARLFRTSLKSYTIVDVPEAILIQAVTARYLDGPLRVVNGLQARDLKWALLPPDDVQRFFVSAYGFSEFDRSLQNWYADRLVRYCPHGFLVWNVEAAPRFTEAPLTITPERPSTGPYNSFVTF